MATTDFYNLDPSKLAYGITDPQAPGVYGDPIGSLPTYSGNTSGNTGITGGASATSPLPTPAPTQPAAPTTPFNYEQARDSWMSGQYGSGEAGARAWAAANGISYSGGDTINLPNGGGYIDIIGNFAGGAGNGQRMANNWTPAGNNGPNPGGGALAPTGTQFTPGSLYTSTAGGIGMPSYGGGSTALSAIPNDPATAAARQQLLSLLGQSGQPIDANDPYIKQTLDAANLQANRQLEQESQANAERLYAMGGGTQANQSQLGTMAQQGRERAATGLAQTAANVYGQEIQARRQQTMQALQLASALGAQQEANQLRQQLAQLDNAYRYTALQQQGALTQQGYGLEAQRMAQQNNQFYSQLGQQQSQWNDQYGLNRLGYQDQMNRAAMLAALGY